MNDQLLQELTKQNSMLTQMLAGKDAKAVTGTPTFTQLHGTDGIWNIPGLEREVVSAHIRPDGIAKLLPPMPTVMEDPRYGVLTGYSAVTGTQPTNACDDAPQGFVKSCTLTARFGMVRFDSQEIEINKAILRANRGDPMDLQLFGQLLGLTNLEPSGLNQNQVLEIVTMSEMFIMAINSERQLSQDIWQGTVAANQGPGLDVQIATGQIDSDTSVACPAADSDVKDFNYNNVDGTDTLNIVDYITSLEFFIHHIAVRTGLMPVRWVWVFRPELWEEFTAVWPCQYNTNKCANSLIGDNSRLVIDGRENIEERDRMRRELTLEVNGRRYDVVVDDGIFEQNNVNDANLAAGEFASSIYFVPLTITGGLPATFRQNLDYRRATLDQRLMPQGVTDFWTDGGLYLWAIENQKYCYKLSLKTEQRVVLRTPHLAGKIDNVKYVPLQHLRSPYPADPYFQDGGASLRTGTRGTAVWD